LRRLLVAIIKQAVDDYRAFEKRGLIVNGRVTAPVRFAAGRRGKKYRGLFVERHACNTLVKFFRWGGAMDDLLAVGGLCPVGDAVRKRLGMTSMANELFNLQSLYGNQRL
jgi:hypothetical protein